MIEKIKRMVRDGELSVLQGKMALILAGIKVDDSLLKELVALELKPLVTA